MDPEVTAPRGIARAAASGVPTTTPLRAPGLLEFTKLHWVRDGERERAVVLVVEDSPDDRDFIAWAFDECGGRVDVRYAEDGEEALEYLGRSGERERRRSNPRPCLILLDLTIPKVSGREVLEIISRDVALRTIPVVVFTGSEDDFDITRCYELGANSYFTKPDTMEGYRSIIRILETYWLRNAELPPRG